MSDLLEAALSYAARGFSVFPCWWPIGDRCSCAKGAACDRKAKHPMGRLVPHGLLDATTDCAVIAGWWTQYPKANVAVRTGIESGLIVLDVDVAKGGYFSLETLEAKHGRLPYSLRVRTGSGGLHVYLKHPGGRRISSNVSGRLGSGLDCKADGGYVIAPDSQHVKGGRYEWLDAESSQLEEAPAWLLGLLSRYDERPPAARSEKIIELPDETAQLVADALLADAIEKVEKGGARHDAGFWLACQCRDNHVPQRHAEIVIRAFECVMNGRGVARFTSPDELDRALRDAYSRAPREALPPVRRVLARLEDEGKTPA